MSKDPAGRKLLRILATTATIATIAATAGCTAASDNEDADTAGGPVTIELAQWWEPELPEGKFRSLMDEFEAANPDIKVKLVSGPYASTKEQLFAGAAAGTMSDVVGLDGAWVSDFAKQGALADLTKLMDDQGYDDSKLASQIKVNGSTFMIPVVNFVYPMFTNDDILAAAGVSAPPTTRDEFAAAAAKITASGGGTSGWVLPLSLEAPNGIQNDVMSWAWASGGTMLKDGKPNVINDDVTSAVEFVKGLYDSGVIAAGSLTMKEQDKVEEFTNGRVGMMIDSLSHINLIRESNPDLNFSISAIPAIDGYNDARGIPYASWGIGVSDTSKHKAEAFKLVEFLMSTEVNSTLSTMANAFPGNTDSKPDFSNSDPLFEEAFAIYQDGTPANEFTGLPVAEELMRQFDEQFQATLTGGQSVSEMLKKTQESWSAEF